MQLGSPSSLAWLLLAIPVIICYLLKVRPRRVSVPSVMLWEQVFEDRKPRALWQRLRHLVSLLVQLLFLLLVALALSNPLLSWQLEQARTIVVVLDNSASMSATDIAPNRLASARGEAIRLINGLRERENMAVVSATEPKVEIGFNDHPRLLARSVDQIPATDSPARLEEAISLAARLIEGKDNGQILVFSDQAAIDDLPAGIDQGLVHFVTIGTRANNVAITQFHVRRSLDDRIAFQILIALENFGDSPVDVQLELHLGDQLLDVLPLQLDADQRWHSVLEYTSADGGTVSATIDSKDALACDNRAVAELTPRLPQPVLLVSPGSFFLEKVLASIAQVTVTTSSTVPATLPDDTMLIVHRTAIDRVPEGMVFCIDPISDSNCWSLGGSIAEPFVSQQDDTSPLMAHLRLAEIALPGARKLMVAQPHQVLAQTLDGAAVYVAMDRPQQRLLVLSADLQRGDLPLRTAFPILMNNALGWFQGQSGELQPSLSTGQVARVSTRSRPGSGGAATGALASGLPLQQLELVAPDGRRRPLVASEGWAMVGPLDQCGIWQLEPKRSSTQNESPVPVRRIACNLANASESDVRIEPQTPTLIRRGAWMSRPVWLYLVLLALTLIGGEWFLYQRRWIS